MGAPTPLTPDQVWAAITEVGLYERHFNEIQSKYRALASTWLLATFAGIGFVLSQESLDLPLSRLVAAGLLALAGAVGVALLWNLDLHVYHRLLEAVWVAALELEVRNSLPPLRRYMFHAFNEGKGARPRLVWFYIATTGVLLMIASSCLATAAWKEDRSWGFVVVCAGVSVTGLALHWMRRVTATPNKFFQDAATDIRSREDQSA